MRIEEALNPVEENLQTQIVDIVRDLQVQLFDLYRSSRTTPPVGTGGGVAEIPAQAQQEQQPLQWIQAGPSTAQQEYSVAGGGLQHTVLDWNPPTIDELELFRPEAPFNDESFNDFSGELFNFQSASMDNPNSPSDSGYASLAILPDFSLFKTHGSQQSDPK